MPTMDRSDLPIPIGAVIAGRYAISGVLGRGGMGVVLAGRHLELGERVAIKFLHKEHAGHADRFFREARAAARIRSEHVVRIFDVGRLPAGEPYIVMEHLQGEDLAGRLERNGPMAPAEVAAVLLDVCHALAEAHAVGIVHRDLKPANIFLARGPGGDDLVKLLDFGVAKVPEAGVLTQTASILGSPVYMSPEQLMASRDVDHRSDIWSLGIVLFELLTGSLPFEGDSLVHLGILVREKPTPSACAQRPDLPQEFDHVIARCLAKHRADRYADVGEFAEALAPFVSAGLAHSIPRIRRVLNEGLRGAALASTVPPPSDPAELPPTVNLPSGSGQTPIAAGSVSLVAVSTSSKAVPLVVERGDKPGRSRLFALLAGAVSVGVVVVAWRSLEHTATEQVSPDAQVALPTVSLSAPLASLSAPATAVSTPPAVVAATTTSAAAENTARVPPPLHTAGAHAKDPRPTSTPARSVSAAPSAPAQPPTAVNCNPPFTIDENGVRRAKRECL